MMKQFILFFGLLFTIGFTVNAQEPWTAKDLMEPETLVQKINSNQTKNTVIIGIGFDDVIKGSSFVGGTRDKNNVNKLKQILAKTPKDKEVVLYCGCCPFGPCPNIRPGFQAAKDAGFKNVKLLNIRQNIKVNWLDKGYPTK